ncbi:MAG: hypothetical protein V4616_14230 [Bacteroidota bacterium]
MDQQEALQLLGLEVTAAADTSEITDAYEEQLFVVKQFFLTSPVIAVLFSKRLQKLEKLDEALETLLPGSIPPASGVLATELPENHLIAGYEAAMSGYKTRLAAAAFGPAIRSEAEGMIAVTAQFEKKILEQICLTYGTPENWPAGYDDSLKIANGLDTVLIARSLKELEQGINVENSRNALLSELYKLVKKQRIAGN